MKIKSSEILAKALSLIESGEQSYACAAIQDVETDLRYANKGRDVKSNAAKYFAAHRPADIPENMKASQGWWPKNSDLRVNALRASIDAAQKRSD